MDDKRKRKNDADSWGDYMHRKVGKLDDQFDANKVQDDSLGEMSTLFNNISIYVNGLTSPSADELKQIMVTYGGRFDHYYSKTRTTYVIANNLAYSKIRNLGAKDEIVKPKWIVDCIHAKRLLPVCDYLVYEPGQVSGQQKIDGHLVKPIELLSPNKGTNSRDVQENETSASVSYQETETVDGEFECVSENLDTESITLMKTQPVEEFVLVSNSPSKKALKAGDPGFLEAYFNRSRLHHISTSGNSFKNYVEELRKNKTPSFSGRSKLSEFLSNGANAEPHAMSESFKPVIMHIDMDCFFVSVGLLKRPDLIGKPIAVTHAKNGQGRSINPESLQFESNFYRKRRKFNTAPCAADAPENDDADATDEERDVPEFTSFAEIACCSYEARACGVRNGTILGSAKRICSDLIVIPYDFEEYTRISKVLYDTVATYSLEIEAMSCDELFVDVTDVLTATNASPDEFASFIRAEILEKTGCPASAGLAPNVLLAKLASKKAKPKGQLVISSDADEIMELFSSLPVRELPGIGYSTSSKLFEALSVETCGDLVKVSTHRLKELFGEKTGEKLFAMCRGSDRSKLKFDQASTRKSVSVEVNYGIRFENMKDIEAFVRELSQEVESRLKKIKGKGNQIALKLKVRTKDAPLETVKYLGHGPCDNLSKSTILRSRTDDNKVIGNQSIDMMRSMNLTASNLRGIGIQVGKLSIESDADSNGAYDPKKMMLEDYFKRQQQNQIVQEKAVPSLSTDPASSSRADEDSASMPPSAQPGPSRSFIPQRLEQVDEEVLNSLPEEIRREILQSLQASTSKKNSSVGSQKSKGMAKSNDKSSGKKAAKVTLGPLDKMFSSLKSGSIDPNKASGKPHVCGETKIESVKEIIKEWIQTEPEIHDEDVAYIMNYCLNLMTHKEWAKLEQIAASLYEYILIRDENVWTEAYNSLIGIILAELSNTDAPESLTGTIHTIDLF